MKISSEEKFVLQCWTLYATIKGVSKLLMVFLMLALNKSYGQNKLNFERIISSLQVGKTFISKSKNDTAWRTYLGAIVGKNKTAKYYVVKEFSKTKAASTWQGHSSIYFLTLDGKLFATFYAGMPEDLPYRLSKNTFYFTYFKNGIRKTFRQNVNGNIPKWFCTGPSECDTDLNNCCNNIACSLTSIV